MNPNNTENKNPETVLFGLSKTLFWDVDLDDLNAQKNARFIVERVLTRGTWDEFKQTLMFYNKHEVAQMATQIQYLDDMVFEFCVTYFNLPKENFKCYTHKQLNHSHWNY